MVITDRYDHVIDDKGRLAIPSQIRNAMDPQEDGSGFYLVPEKRYLQLIPEKLFKRLASHVTAGLAISPDLAEVRRSIFANATYLEPDKQGRVIIPDHFMVDSPKQSPFTQVKLQREVTLVGNNDRLELWNRTVLESHMVELAAASDRLQLKMQEVFKAPAPAPQRTNGGSAGEL
jgi:MraZ protein